MKSVAIFLKPCFLNHSPPAPPVSVSSLTQVSDSRATGVGVRLVLVGKEVLQEPIPHDERGGIGPDP